MGSIIFNYSQMVVNIWVYGKMVNKMAMEHIRLEMEHKRKEYGKMEQDFIGWKTDNCLFTKF